MIQNRQNNCQQIDDDNSNGESKVANEHDDCQREREKVDVV
jgi:hypothetical protein